MIRKLSAELSGCMVQQRQCIAQSTHEVVPQNRCDNARVCGREVVELHGTMVEGRLAKVGPGTIESPSAGAR